MATHIEIKDNKVKVFLRKVMKDFWKNYDNLKTIKEGNSYNPDGSVGYYRKYDFKGIRITELEEKGYGNARTSIWVDRKDIPKSALKWCDETMGGKSPDYSFEYTYPQRKYYFVA